MSILLQREQLAQKLDKRKRARRYRIIKAVSGSKLPIGHGFAVFCHPPCTDEPRIKLDVGDIVIVTRWKKYISSYYFYIIGTLNLKKGKFYSRNIPNFLRKFIFL